MKKPVIIDEFEPVDYAYLNHLLMEDLKKNLGVLLRRHSVNRDIREDIISHIKFSWEEMDEHKILGSGKNKGIFFDMPKAKRAELLKNMRKTVKYQKFSTSWKSA